MIQRSHLPVDLIGGRVSDVGDPPDLARSKPDSQRPSLAPGTVVVEHVPLIAITALYVAVGQFALKDRASELSWVPSKPFVYMLALYVFGTAVAHFFSTLLSADGAHRLILKRATWREFRRNVWGTERILGGAIVMLLYPPMVTTFSRWKDAIPSLHAFQFDEDFARIDRLLHFGIDPWRLTHGMVPSSSLLRVIDGIYFTGWAFTLVFALTIAAWGPPGRLRMQFLLSFTLSWILLGSGLATALASAGPCFYEAVTGAAGGFDSLLNRLHRIDAGGALASVELQAHLWNAYVEGGRGVASGISAMPSMHVATASVVALASRRVGRVAGVVGFGFLGLILFGSVHLGWHYAIDGYVSIIAVLGIWLASGRFLSAYDAGTAQGTYA